MKRPFRIYDSKTKKNLRSRCYSIFRNAHVSALIHCRWGKVGDVLEVVDTNGGMYGQYKRGVSGITFTKVREEI